MKIFLVIIISILLFSTEAQCYLLNYGPFPNNKEFQVYSMTTPEFKEVKSQGIIEWEREYQLQNLLENTQINVFAHADKGIFASIINPNFKIKPFNVGVMPFTFEKLLVAHLNQDKKEDFVFIAWTGGNGLASAMAYITFALSLEQGYKIIQTTTFEPSEADFIKINGECKFIQTAFIYGEEGKDGKAHNYWVYNLFGFTGPNITPQNHLIANFPKWIMYSSMPNHSATTQLSPEQKQRLWAEEEKELFVIPGNYEDNIN